MAEAAAYLLTLMLFSFVIVGSVWMRHEMLLLACIPAGVRGAVVGFVMAIYAGDDIRVAANRGGHRARRATRWWLARRFNSRDLLIAIYLGWACALVVATGGNQLPRPCLKHRPLPLSWLEKSPSIGGHAWRLA